MRYIYPFLLFLATPLGAATLCEVPDPAGSGLDAQNVCQQTGGCSVTFKLTYYCSPDCTYVGDGSPAGEDFILRNVTGFPFGEDADVHPLGCPNMIASVEAGLLIDEPIIIRERIAAGTIACREGAPQFPEDVVGITDCNTADAALLRLCNFHRQLVRRAMRLTLTADGNDFNSIFYDCALAIGANFWGTTGGPEVNKTRWLNVHSGNPSGWDRINDRSGTLTGINPQLAADIPGIFEDDGSFAPCPEAPKGCAGGLLQ